MNVSANAGQSLPPRDLSFKPVDNAAPKHLTHQQIASYNESGFLKPFRVFNDDEAAANRAYFDRLLDLVKQRNDGRDAYAINGYQTQCQGLYDLVTHPRILDLVEDICGPDFVCWGAHYFCKLPGDSKSVPWHQDASYWPFDKARTVTAWLAIDDADVENGCMHVIPGTHRVGHLEWKPTQQEAVLGQEVVDPERFGKPVPFELKAGEISLHADMLVHGSQPNRSSRRRCGLTIRYCPVSVRGDWNKTSILCRGRDPDGFWANVPRPTGEDVTPKPWQLKVKAG